MRPHGATLPRTLATQGQTAYLDHSSASSSREEYVQEDGIVNTCTDCQARSTFTAATWIASEETSTATTEMTWVVLAVS